MRSPEPSYSPEHRRLLLDLARSSIDSGLAGGAPAAIDSSGLAAPLCERRATFVTLRRHGELRGCVGSIEPSRSLAEDVSQNAFHSAFRDPRFPPLTAVELEGLAIHVSVLSPLEPVEVQGEAELQSALRPGVDGLVLRAGVHRATFLPAVWEQLDDPVDFLRELKRKARLPTEGWGPDYRVVRYTTESFEAPAINETPSRTPAQST